MTTPFRTDFNVDVADRTPALLIPQRLGRLLWAPMLLMALMAFPIGLAIGLVRANLIATGADEAMIAGLAHLGPAAMFLGFASVFAAISFAIARILGVLRIGGSQVQEAAGRPVQTLRKPLIATAFIGLMAMAMMVVLAGVAGNAVVGAAILGGDTAALAQSESWAIWFEGVRRIGTATYLVAIALGLATIIEVLRFQAVRVRELASEPDRRNATA